MNLNQIKQEAREELFGRFDLVITKDRAQHDFPEQEEAEKRLSSFLEGTLDRLVDEIEKAVQKPIGELTSWWENELSVEDRDRLLGDESWKGEVKERHARLRSMYVQEFLTRFKGERVQTRNGIDEEGNEAVFIEPAPRDSNGKLV